MRVLALLGKCKPFWYLNMEPLALIAITAAAGFVFTKICSDRDSPKEPTYSKDIVSHITNKPQDAADFEISAIEVLPEYELAKALIQREYPILFVTGGAGTGKSTFIRWLLREFKGSVLLGAPTAMAALNIGGKTLHSMCKLPPAWIVRDDIKVRHWQEFKEAKLLIIDEISMVNANLLDGVSTFFRKNRGINKPFGGLPVVMIGDLFQLPPVKEERTKHLFDQYYFGSLNFYNANCLESSTYYAIELKKAYRQTDQKFIDALSKIREGIDVSGSIQIFNSECAITNLPPRGAVWLSPRRMEVESINKAQLSKLVGPSKWYAGKFDGNFSHNQDKLPSPHILELKQETQVMFTKNDEQKRWINGTVGIVDDMDSHKIIVKLAMSGNRVEVRPTSWEEYEYFWNNKTREIDRRIIGTYTQFPLTHAWAITIHKSQGRTIERVHLDLGSGVFATGQTYVALSRCRSFEGLSMSRYLVEKDIKVDPESIDFYNQLRLSIRNAPPEKMRQLLGLAPVSSDYEIDVPF